MTDEVEDVVLLTKDTGAQKKKMVIVWQCLNPECTNSRKRCLR